MRLLGWALIQYDWYKKRKSEHRQTEGGHVKTQGEDDRLPVKEGASEETKGLLAFRTTGKQISVLSSPESVALLRQPCPTNAPDLI